MLGLSLLVLAHPNFILSMGSFLPHFSELAIKLSGFCSHGNKWGNFASDLDEICTPTQLRESHLDHSTEVQSYPCELQAQWP